MDTTTTDDQATLELGIDGVSDPFLLSTATPVGNGGYRWDGTGLDWSSETSVTVRLREEEPPTLSVADAAGNEGDDKVVFTVTLSKPYYAATSATWTASIGTGDTAVAADLGTTKTGTVAFAAQATTATFEVPVVDDGDGRGRRDLHGDAVEPDSRGCCETGGGPDGHGHDRGRRRDGDPADAEHRRRRGGTRTTAWSSRRR